MHVLLVKPPSAWGNGGSSLCASLQLTGIDQDCEDGVHGAAAWQGLLSCHMQGVQHCWVGETPRADLYTPGAQQAVHQ